MRKNLRMMAVGTVVLTAVVGTVATSPAHYGIDAAAADGPLLLDATMPRITRKVKIHATSPNAVDPTASSLEVLVGGTLVNAQGRTLVANSGTSDGGASDPVVVASLHAVGATPADEDGGSGTARSVTLDPTSPARLSSLILAGCAKGANCDDVLEVTYSASGFTGAERVRITADATVSLVYSGGEPMQGDAVTVEWAE